MTRYKFKWADGKNNSEHKVIYVKSFGPVPEGFHIHHKDGDRWNNDPSNLEALPGLDHRRLHAENYQRNEAGEWMKWCRACGELKPLGSFHTKTTIKGNKSTKTICKPCRNEAGKKWRQEQLNDPKFVERERKSWRKAAAKQRANRHG